MEITKEIIAENIYEPQKLEDLYQFNKKLFAETIKTMYEPESNPIIKYWYVRLFYKPSNKKNNTAMYILTAFLIILAWIPLRLVFINSIVDNGYLIKAVPIVFSAVLSLFFLFGSKKIKSVKNIVICILPNIIMFIYIILLPINWNSQSLKNAFLFMFILLWFFPLFAYSNCSIKKLRYADFLEKFGETMVWSAIFIMGGAVIVLLSLALFNAIKIDAVNFYQQNIVTLGLVASPFVSLLVIDNIGKVKLSVIIANIFLPLILVSLVAFGIISVFTETKPYEDRNIFIVYNIMMVIVICVLSFTGINGINNRIINICSYVLPLITVVLDVVTISAVIYRLNNYGITANKITLLGTNVFMLGHLIYMIFLKMKHKIEQNVLYLPVYFVWAVIVVFIFPFIFKMA